MVALNFIIFEIYFDDTYVISCIDGIQSNRVSLSITEAVSENLDKV
jgi:hypothetical protein